MKNKVQKLVTSLVLAAFSMNGIAMASPVRSPEFNLLEGLIRVSGSYDARTPDGAAHIQQSTDAAVTQYLANPTSDPDTATQNMKDAMVEMGIYTPSQANQFLLDAQAGVKAVLTKQGASDEEMSKQLATEILTVSRMNPVGAQFSGCDFGTGLGIAGIVGLAGSGVTAAVGGIIRLFNPNCTTEQIPVTTTTTDNSPLGIVTTTVTNYKSEKVCGPNPHDATSDSILKYAGLAAAASAVTTVIGLIISTHSEGC